MPHAGLLGRGGKRAGGWEKIRKGGEEGRGDVGMWGCGEVEGKDGTRMTRHDMAWRDAA